MSGPAGDLPRRERRALDGIVLLDKPPGMTSNHALQRVRRLLSAAKAGHAGTLDPMATGMLPLCFGQATKACGQLLGSRKAYRARLVLGVATDTGDADGTVTRTMSVPQLDERTIERVLAGFTGTVMQTPPMYSALKREGRPLYELARAGAQVAREQREVRIESLSLSAWSSTEIEFEVVCSKGTYVRVLAEDIAVVLGTLGHLGALRRLWVEPFEAEPMVTLQAIEEWASSGGIEPAGQSWLLPVDRALTGLPRLDLDAQDALYLRQGRTLASASGRAVAATARAYDETGRFLGLVTIDGSGAVRVERLFVPGAG